MFFIFIRKWRTWIMHITLLSRYVGIRECIYFCYFSFNYQEKKYSTCFFILKFLWKIKNPLNSIHNTKIWHVFCGSQKWPLFKLFRLTRAHSDYNNYMYCSMNRDCYTYNNIIVVKNRFHGVRAALIVSVPSEGRV